MKYGMRRSDYCMVTYVEPSKAHVQTTYSWKNDITNTECAVTMEMAPEGSREIYYS